MPEATATTLSICLGFFLCSSRLFSQESPLDTRLAQEWAEVVRPILREHCGECHMQTSNEGGVNLEDYQDLDKIRQHASTWEQIRGVIRADAMPPPESSTLKMADREKLIVWVQSALHDVDCGCAPPPPKVTLRRLNQVMKRVTLPSLDSDCLPVLRDARQLLNQHGEELLHAVAPEAAEPEFSLTRDNC